VSVVIPALNEEPNIDLLLVRFDAIKQANSGYRFEFVVVDDGSTDRTRELLLQARSTRSDLVIVALTRNFGSHYAFSAGLEACTGDCAVGLGADLQEPLELTSRFLGEWRAGSDVVWGIREVRAQGFASRTFSRSFTALLTRYSDIDGYPAEGPSGFLISRVVIDVVGSMPETNRNLLGLIAWSGFRQSRVSYEQDARTGGTSKWTTTKKLKLAVDSFVEFSHAPVRFMTYIGTFIAVLGFIYAAVVSIRRLAWDNPIEGWTTVVVAVTIIGGLNLMMLGVLGEYMWRATDETRRRPLYVVEPLPESDVYRGGDSEVSENHDDV
jgi:dolichol-phosphate mannosyltransferase